MMKANSSFDVFIKQKQEFCERLKERGYPGWFIRKCKHPNYANIKKRLLYLNENKDKKYDNIIKIIKSKGIIDELTFKMNY